MSEITLEKKVEMLIKELNTTKMDLIFTQKVLATHLCKDYPHGVSGADAVLNEYFKVFSSRHNDPENLGDSSIAFFNLVGRWFELKEQEGT